MKGNQIRCKCGGIMDELMMREDHEDGFYDETYWCQVCGTVLLLYWKVPDRTVIKDVIRDNQEEKKKGEEK